MTDKQRVARPRSRPVRSKRIQDRTPETAAGEKTLRALRNARKRMRVRLVSKLGVTHQSVSRMARGCDLWLATLQKNVEASGGQLSLVAEFPDQPPVVLSGIADPKATVKGKSQRRKSRTRTRA